MLCHPAKALSLSGQRAPLMLMKPYQTMTWVTAHNTQTLADVNRASSSFLRLTQDTNPLVSAELELGPIHCYMVLWSIPCTLGSLPTSRPGGLGTILSLGGDRPFLHTLSHLGKASSLRVSSSQPITPLPPLFVVFNPHSHLLYEDIEAQSGEVIFTSSSLRAQPDPRPAQGQSSGRKQSLPFNPRCPLGTGPLSLLPIQRAGPEQALPSRAEVGERGRV